MAKRKRVVKISDIKQCAKLQCTAREAAAFLSIRVHTFNDLLQNDPHVRKAWDDGKQLGCISLRRKQMRLAGQNATMAIFLGKQMLGQRDIQSHELSGIDGETLNLSDLTKEERDKLRELISRGDKQDSNTE